MIFSDETTRQGSPLPIQAPALSALLARNPLLRTVCDGVAVGPVLGPRAALVSAEGRRTNVDPRLQLELCALANRWAERVNEIGLTLLAAVHQFSDERASETFVLDGRDTAALHEALAGAMAGTELEPSTTSCTVRIVRDPLRACHDISVAQTCSARAETWEHLSAAAWRWYLPRRQWFSSLREAYFEIDGATYWGWAARNGPCPALIHTPASGSA